ncbi:LytR/AlgR family response regulator transcription factor [Tellurirhabdus rosea]|uniref:LytR/AlgR family response regulator transcription factor n=1 Tax=Tellurirhabdus rosea TaxID=2674997 RepID=UPI0022538D8B|nr:LytTR family DNA-binding domain-containing protein [Tellurirhabdus rosea]
MKLRCLLIDDEPPALEVLQSYIEMVDGFEIAGKCYNAVQAFGVLQEKPVDLLFLDIKMPRLLGTDFLRSLRQPPKVIFTTAYPDYALEGYELDAVDYLLKPIPFERFLKAVAKVMRTDAPVLAAAEVRPAAQEPTTFLYFRADRKMVKVFTRDILYVESLKDYVKIVLTTGRPLVVKQTISSVEEMLPETAFLRIHRSFVVAIDKITAYTPTHIDVAGQELPVGRLYQKEVGRVLKMAVE